MELCAGQYQGTRWATPVLAGLRVDEQINVGELPGECVCGGGGGLSTTGHPQLIRARTSDPLLNVRPTATALSELLISQGSLPFQPDQGWTLNWLSGHLLWDGLSSLSEASTGLQTQAFHGLSLVCLLNSPTAAIYPSGSGQMHSKLSSMSSQHITRRFGPHISFHVEACHT